MLNIILENQYLLEQYLHGYTSFSQTFGQLLYGEKYFRTYFGGDSCSFGWIFFFGCFLSIFENSVPAASNYFSWLALAWSVMSKLLFSNYSPMAYVVHTIYIGQQWQEEIHQKKRKNTFFQECRERFSMISISFYLVISNSLSMLSGNKIYPEMFWSFCMKRAKHSLPSRWKAGFIKKSTLTLNA